MQKGIHKICSSEIAQDECPLPRQSAAKLKLYLLSRFIKFCSPQCQKIALSCHNIKPTILPQSLILSLSKPTQVDTDKMNLKM